MMVAIVSAVALVVPSSARTAPGDSWESQNASDGPIAISAPFSVTATSSPVHTQTFYSLTASRGQTVEIRAHVPSQNANVMIGTFTDSNVVESSPITGDPSFTQRVTFMAWRSGTYLMVVSCDDSGTCGVEGIVTAAQSFSLASMGAPTSVRHKTKFTVSAASYPAYNSVGCPIQFAVEHKVGKRWKTYGKTNANFVGEFLSGRYSKATASIKISKAGTYRVRAKLTDAAHSKAVYSTWKTVKIK